MGKRFTETNKWSDPWYRELTPEAKHGWNYLCDNCDPAGVIALDRKLADFQIGAAVDWDALVEGSEGRIKPIGGRKLWITGFIQFQYGKLSEDCKAHRQVFASIVKHSLDVRVSKDIPKGSEPLKDKDKDKDTDKDKEEGGVGETEFAAWWSTVPNKVGKQAAAKAYRNAVRNVRNRPAAEGEGGDDPHGFLLARMLAFSKSPKAKGQYCPHPATWLNEGRYDDDPETWKSNGNEHGRRDIGPGQRHDPSAAKSREGVVGW